jgi:hypothetical protein
MRVSGGLRAAVGSVNAVARVAIAASGLAIAVLATAHIATARLSTANISPLPASKVIVGAAWAGRRYNPPSNQWGDILPTIWGDDGNQYTLMDDGGVDVPLSGGIWRQSLARVSGTPPRVRFTHIGDREKPPPATFGQVRNNPKLWLGPLGPYYSSGLVEANRVFYATQQLDWNWNANGPFAGLAGIAYSVDRGQDWQFASKQFPAPLGNLNWVIRGQGGFYADGYVYAIATEREFNANVLIMGRSRADVADMTDPARWQWVSGWTQYEGLPWPVFSSSLAQAVPIVSWGSHITYPQMAYDAPIHRYLLTFTYSYSPTPPGIWRNGADLVLLEAQHPWGPFSFVAHEPNFGPSNGYGAGIPVKWISRNGRDIWLKWSANFDGCAGGLDCSGAYGFNYRRIHLTVAKHS